MRATEPQRHGDTEVLGRAIEVFARGFAFTRSRVYPCLAERVGKVWVVRDAERSRKSGYRREEFIACGTPPAEVDRLARQHTRGRFAVCAILPAGEEDGALRAGYKALGYRLGFTEPLMVHRLKGIPRCVSPAEVVRVNNTELAARLAKAKKHRGKPLEAKYFGADSPLRQYAAIVDGKIVGWVRSVVVGDWTWCADMHVAPPYRRRGIARGMLCQMLADDRKKGSTLAVLLASHTGAKLYPVVGYEEVGMLYLFTPGKK